VIWGVDLVGRDGPIYGENGPVEAQGGRIQPEAEVCRRRDLNPIDGGDRDETNQDEKKPISTQTGSERPKSKSGKGQKRDSSGHKKSRSGRKKCDLCVTCPKMPGDLKRVIRVWTGLTEGEKAQILGMVASDEG